MSKKIRMIKIPGFTITLKAKFISAFVILILAMSVVSITTFITLKKSIAKLDDMIQMTIITNSLPDVAENSLDVLLMEICS